MKSLLHCWKSGPLSLIISLLTLLIGSQFTLAEIAALDSEVTAYEFIMGDKKSGRPIVGVKSPNRVYVRLPDNSIDVVSPDPRDMTIVKKVMNPVGRVTICKTEARSERASRIDSDVVAEMTGRNVQLEMGETLFRFDMVADRDIEGVYVALFLYHVDRPKEEIVDFGRIGDLKSGEFSSREIIFPNTTVTDGMEYRFEFFTNGSPLEMYMLPNVALNPASASLNVPFDVRLNCYLTRGKEARHNANPRPWRMGFKTIDLESYKARGANDMKIKIRVKADGSVDLVDGDPRMTEQEVSDLQSDISKWQFFPELKKGKPKDKLVAAPLKL